MAKKSRKITKGSTAIVKTKRSASAAAAIGGVRNGEQFERVMGNLMSDLLDGSVQPQVANAVCNVGEKMLRMATMRFKYGANTTFNGKAQRA